jgi:hypothetical protein
LELCQEAARGPDPADGTHFERANRGENPANAAVSQGEYELESQENDGSEPKDRGKPAAANHCGEQEENPHEGEDEIPDRDIKTAGRGYADRLHVTKIEPPVFLANPNRVDQKHVIGTHPCAAAAENGSIVARQLAIRAI